MTRTLAKAALSVVGALVMSVLFVAPESGVAGGTVSFTRAQVVAGAKGFAQSCASCHGTNLEGGAGPALSGPNFKTLSTKIHASVGDVFTYLTTNMPMNAPAGLTHDQYTDIMAYILSKNGYKPGGSALNYKNALSSKAKIIKD
ncbi:MAG: c-type cytochrome [Vulcanimicrobiaceae bacterium]